MRGMIPLRDLTMENLRDMAATLERRARVRVSEETRLWPRARLVKYIEELRPPERQKLPRAKRPRMPKNLGVGKYCRDLLAKVIGHTEDQLPIGLSYNEMVRRARKKFPDSCVDERHLRWYAAKMRREDQLIPVHRKRSRWQ